MERDYQAESKQEVTDAINTIMHELNGGNRKEIAKAIHERVSREHRTLQQAFWSTMLLTQIAYAENPHDLRNEQAVKLAGLVRELAIKNNMDMGLMYV